MTKGFSLENQTEKDWREGWYRLELQALTVSTKSLLQKNLPRIHYAPGIEQPFKTFL